MIVESYTSHLLWGSIERSFFGMPWNLTQLLQKLMEKTDLYIKLSFWNTTILFLRALIKKLVNGRETQKS